MINCGNVVITLRDPVVFKLETLAKFDNFRVPADSNLRSAIVKIKSFVDTNNAFIATLPEARKVASKCQSQGYHITQEKKRVRMEGELAYVVQYQGQAIFSVLKDGRTTLHVREEKNPTLPIPPFVPLPPASNPLSSRCVIL